MPNPVLTLTTDFGLADHYVGTMKGVILSICPRAQIVDISHEATPFQIGEGAFVIAQAYRYFPAKTVHVIVIDPGVGTARRAILVEAAGQYFVAPDNGVLSLIYAREKSKVRLIENERLFLKPVSQTFHGRDIFAPVAAHIAAGTPVARVGKAIHDYVCAPFEKPVQTGKQAWRGCVLKIDHFGNIVTNFRASEFPDLGRRKFVMAVGTCQTSLATRNYDAAGPGKLFAIVGSSGFWEISASQDSAVRRAGCQAGAPVKLTTG
jgi:S-adenosyl-L-methionine hydrolase (adenosine-forming)